jgi:enoyl-[acyl-carrier protein] reductase II
MQPIKTRISQIFDIDYPVIQGGMVWCSGWKLASAVSNSGGLGLIGSGSMTPEILKEHIQKAKKATNKPFGVNVPLIHSHAEENIKVILEERIKIVFTSAGNPDKWTKILRDEGTKVIHVIANSTFARKAENAGVDAVVAEGFEAGGHNGREETTTFSLIPTIKQVVSVPVIAAGGIGTGRGILAALALGAEGVQLGSVFAASKESSAHINFKKEIIRAGEGDTRLTMKKLIPVRLLKNSFYAELNSAIQEGRPTKEIMEILGSGRPRKGMFEGNIDEGELEIGQISSLINIIRSVDEIMKKLILDFHEAGNELKCTLRDLKKNK